MNIALAQIDINAGDPKSNVAKILEYIAKAKAEKAEVVALPEMCVGGYFIGDLWLDDEYCRYLMEFNQQIIDATDGIAVIWGNVYLDERETLLRKDGKEIRNVHNDGRKRRYNAAYAYKDGQPLKRYRGSYVVPNGLQFKSLLPNYREFDDKRYFASTLDLIQSDCLYPLDACSPFKLDIDGVTYNIGVEICEDLWCEDYDFNPTSLMYSISDAIINISSSPWTYGKNGARDRRVKNVVEWRDTGAAFYYVNCVGVQNNGKNFFTFDGGSTIYGYDGKPKVLAKTPYEEELIVCDWAEVPKYTAKRKNRMMIEDKYLAIVRGIQHLRDMLGFEKYTIGLSGGIDSAVVACLLVKAVGKENVIAVNMPSRYNSDKTKSAAEKIARRLGIKYYVAPIEDMYTANSLSILPFVNMCGKTNGSLLAENIQAKIRGTSLLSNIAAATNSLFTNNGNKVETALGYATLYGDVGGAVSPIADLTKEEVYKMAWYLNNECFKKNPIPQNLLPNEYYQFEANQIQPSAELKDAQVDPIKIGYHCKLVEQFMNYTKKSPADIMTWWLEAVLPEKLGMSEEFMEIYELRDAKVFLDDLEWFCRQIRANVFKRVQSPPSIVVSKTAYGFDLRESILPWFRFTRKEQELYDEILDIGWY